MADPMSPIPAHFTDLSCLIWSIFGCLASVSLATIKIRQKQTKDFSDHTIYGPCQMKMRLKSVVY